MSGKLSNERNTIRPARLRDAPAIARVQVQSWREAYPGLVSQAHLDRLDVALATERWIRRIGARVARIFVAEHEGRVVGFASAGPPQQPELGYDAALYTLYVLRSAQKLGLGRGLFEAARDAMQSEGHRSLYCWVIEGNSAAAFFRRLGGKSRGEKLVEIGGGPVTENLFVWRLRPVRASALSNPLASIHWPRIF